MNFMNAISQETCKEIAGLMSAASNIMTGQTNNNAAAVVFDALAGSYMLSLADTIVDIDVVSRARMVMEDDSVYATLGRRLDKYHVPKNSGRALLSATFPENFFYRKGDVVIREGILTNGVLDKATLGSEAGSIIQALYKDYGQERTVVFLTDIYRVAGVFMDTHSLSVTMDDCYLDQKGRKAIRYEIEKSKMLVKSMGQKLPDPLEEERREAQIRGYLDTAKNFGSKISKEFLAPTNAFNIMSGSGAKGSQQNLTNITGILGQQFIAGERIKETIPYFDSNDLDPITRGFIVNSFLTGLTPAEVFFSAMATRPAVVESATSISDVGTIHRHLTKAMENLKVVEDGSVRNSAGVIYQFTYEDGFDPSLVESVRAPSGSFTNFVNLERFIMKANAKYGY